MKNLYIVPIVIKNNILCTLDYQSITRNCCRWENNLLCYSFSITTLSNFDKISIHYNIVNKTFIHSTSHTYNSRHFSFCHKSIFLGYKKWFRHQWIILCQKANTPWPWLSLKIQQSRHLTFWPQTRTTTPLYTVAGSFQKTLLSQKNKVHPISNQALFH